MAESHAMVSIAYKESGIPAYRTCAREGEQHSALILIHEVWGLTDHIKSIADRLCKEGYEVIAPDLLAGTSLDGVITPDMQNDLFDPQKRSQRQPEIRALMAPLGSPEFSAEVIAKLQVCFNYLKAESSVTKIGVIGFCFGGTYSFGLATKEAGLAAAVPFYGHGEQFKDDFANISCPVMAFYGGTDEALNAHIPEIEEAMRQAGKNFAYKVYDGASHAFFNDTNPFTYKKEAATDAWQQTLIFLAQNLAK